MAFFAAFAPVLPRLPSASFQCAGGSQVLALPAVTPCFGGQKPQDLPEQAPGPPGSWHDVDVGLADGGDDAGWQEGSQSQFAPMLFFKRAQAESSWANHAIGPFTRLQEKTGLLDQGRRYEEEKLQEAADTLEIGLRALSLAEEIARSICDDLSGWRDPSERVRLSMDAVASSSGAVRDEPDVHSPLAQAGSTCERGEAAIEGSLPNQWLRDAYAEIHQVAASVAHMAAGTLGEASPAPAVVEGVLHVDGGSELDASLLQDILREILLEVLGEVQVKDVELVCTALRPISIFDFAPAVLEDRSGSVAFAFKVSACDPNDLEPLRETLLLEAESGGARHLLPLLAQKLCDGDLPTPRHLKVRIEVGEA